jgi:hypothetical protein
MPEPVTLTVLAAAVKIAAAKGALTGVAKALPLIEKNLEEAVDTAGREIGQAIGLDPDVREAMLDAFKDGIHWTRDALDTVTDLADGIG